MKKIIAILLSLVLLCGLVACGSNNTDTKTPDSGSQTEKPDNTVQAPDNDDDKDPVTDGKTLVVYFSASGSTEKVAKTIATAAGADIFEIVPTEEYTSEDLNWTNSNSRVCREHDDESLRDIPLATTTVPNWENYDTVLIGYPIWWGIAAWPVDNFVKSNDFSGKTVIPFCTSASSGIGNSSKLLADMAGTGTWKDGERFSSGASDSTVTEWVSTLDLGK